MSAWRRGWKKIKDSTPTKWKRVWIANYPNATHYSPNFTRAELDCKCGCATPKHIEKALRQTAVQLEKLRKHWNAPMHITSGYRCVTHNRRVGGAPNSQHLQGKAADVIVARFLQDGFVQDAEKVPAFKNGGIGRYPAQGFVHVDRRGTHARWVG